MNIDLALFLLHLDKEAEFLAVLDRLLCHAVAVLDDLFRHIPESGRAVGNDLKRLPFFISRSVSRV